MLRLFAPAYLIFTVVSCNAFADMPKGEYLDGHGSKAGVILAHGQGLSPTSHVVDPLRRSINSQLGLHTLSLQMPVLPGRKSVELFQEYGETFPEAYKSIQSGIDFLKEKGVERIYLMGYSMGARMMTGFLAEHPDPLVVGYIGVGMLGGGETPLNTNVNLRKIKIPVLDIYAESDKDAKFAEFRKPFVSERYVQIPIPGATHDYRCCEANVSSYVVKWVAAHEAAK